jgi:hypothetical protein
MNTAVAHHDSATKTPNCRDTEAAFAQQSFARERGKRVAVERQAA